MAEPIEIPFGLRTRVGPRKYVLRTGAHWRHMVNTTEPSMCDGDAACCQITLITYFALDSGAKRCDGPACLYVCLCVWPLA